MSTRVLLRRLRSEIRYRLEYPTAYRLGLVKAGFRRMSDAQARTIAFLIISDGVSYTSEQQFAPLRRYARRLRRQLGVVFQFMRLSDGLRLDRPALARFDAVGLKLDFRESRAEQIVTHFHERISGTSAQLVYFDGDDDVCVQWPAVLRQVDLYVKKGVFAAAADYLRPFVGKNNITDFVFRHHGTPPAAQDIPASGVLEPADLGKLHLGWSIGLDDKIAELFEKMEPVPPAAKDLDIVCRASIRRDWLYPLRHGIMAPLEPLKDRYRVLLPTDRVPQDQYYEEMRRSRICVSPLGYGELCWRDFEAILCGCLLVKPDMSHLRTHPNIFIPGETYAPVRWDHSDLAETCIHYLEHEPERTRIAANAYRVLADYYRQDGFVATFTQLLDRLGLPRAPSRSPSSAFQASP
jgi:glycosyltransferase involved in cell wall biosynthesis